MVRKKILERKRAQDAKDAKAALLAAETELRATRTRQKSNKVDYVYELGSEVSFSCSAHVSWNDFLPLTSFPACMIG